MYLNSVFKQAVITPARRYEIGQQTFRGRRDVKVWPQVRFRQDGEYRPCRHGLVISEVDLFTVVLPALLEMYGLELTGLEVLQEQVNQQAQSEGWVKPHVHKEEPLKAYECAGDAAFRAVA